jgi:hypothetical protein
MTGDPNSILPQIRDQLKPVLQALEAKIGHPVIAYILRDGAQVADDVYPSFCDTMRNMPATEEISVLIHTNGGQTETPYKLMSLLRNYADRVNVLIASKALSAGTHFAMGADKIIMTREAQMGPVDPSRQHPLLPKGDDDQPLYISVQDLRHCVEFIKREAGSDLSSDAFAHVISALFQQVHPLAIGSIEEAYALGKLVSRKMLEMHMDPQNDQATIAFLVNELSDGYKSHHFAYGYKEAKKIGLKVELAPPELEKLMTTTTFTLVNQDITGNINDVPGASLVFMGCLLSISGGAAFHMHIMTPVPDAQPAQMRSIGSQWVWVP